MLVLIYRGPKKPKKLIFWKNAKIPNKL